MFTIIFFTLSSYLIVRSFSVSIYFQYKCHLILLPFALKPMCVPSNKAESLKDRYAKSFLKVLPNVYAFSQGIYQIFILSCGEHLKNISRKCRLRKKECSFRINLNPFIYYSLHYITTLVHFCSPNLSKQLGPLVTNLKF